MKFSDLDQGRALMGAFAALIAFSCVGAMLISNDLYSGRAEMGSEEDMGWWKADLDYGFFNGTIWIVDNDNLIGNPAYTGYVVNYTGQDRTLMSIGVIGFSGGIVFSLVTFVFAFLTSIKRVSWVLPFTTGVLALSLVLIPTVLLYGSVPGIVESDLELLDPYISDQIPPDQMDNFTNNLSRGSTFSWGFLSFPFLVVAPLLMVCIKREKPPSPHRLAYNFFIEGKKEKQEKKVTRNHPDVKGGPLQDRSDPPRT